jgi:hypothetical protein
VKEYLTWALLLFVCLCVYQAGTESAQAPQLYTVLEQRKANVGAGLMGTDHVYVLPGQDGAATVGPGGKRRCVCVSLGGWAQLQRAHCGEASTRVARTRWLCSRRGV